MSSTLSDCLLTVTNRGRDSSPILRIEECRLINDRSRPNTGSRWQERPSSSRPEVKLTSIKEFPRSYPRSILLEGWPIISKCQEPRNPRGPALIGIPWGPTVGKDLVVVRKCSTSRAESLKLSTTSVKTWTSWCPVRKHLWWILHHVRIKGTPKWKVQPPSDCWKVIYQLCLIRVGKLVWWPNERRRIQKGKLLRTLISQTTTSWIKGHDRIERHLGSIKVHRPRTRREVLEEE